MALTEVNSLGIKNLEVKEADIANDAVTLDKMASGTDGKIISYDSSGNPVAVGPGSVGDVLTSQGSGNQPVFSAIPNQLTDNSVTLAKMAGLARGKIIVGDSNNDPVALAAGSNDQILTMDANGDVGWEAPAASGAALTGSTNNTVCTVTGANAIAGEANLTFDGNDLTLGDGNVILASGHGISFSATADSSASMDQELFDDYEEGECNDVHLEFGGTDAGSVDGQSKSRYVKIGTLVWASGYIKMDLTSPNPSGGAKLVGLPYSVHEFGQPHNWVSIGHFISNGKCTDANVILMIGNSGGSKVHLGHDDGSDVHYLTDTSFGTGQWLHCQYDLLYRTTA